MQFIKLYKFSTCYFIFHRNGIKEEIKNIGVKVQGITIKMLHFTDDITLLASTERELEEALNVTKKV